MTAFSKDVPEEESLPRRDWIKLPLLGLATVVLLVCSTEIIARMIYTESKTAAEDCMVPNGSSSSVGGGIPNGVCWEKIAEGQPTEYRFNSNGYRSDTDFGPKVTGAFRIVVIGSSFAVGARVPIAEAFATKLSPELSRLTGQKVEIVNEGMAGAAGFPSIVALRFKDALAAKPDMILRILTPWDIQNESVAIPKRDRNTGSSAQKSRIAQFLSRVREFRLGNLYVHAAFMLRHLLYKSQSQYVKSFLMSGDSTYDTGFLRAETNAEWKRQLLRFSNADAGIEQRVKAAGVPLVTVFIPLRVQAAMISMGEWPAEFDPFKLDNELRAIITSHGGTYIDILPEFRNIPNPEQGYYPVEGHLNARGHTIIARLLAKELASRGLPALRSSANSQAAQDYGR
jgi:hypothetical protein